MASGLQEMTVKTATPSKTTRTQKIEVSLFATEKAEIDAAALRLGHRSSAWMRGLALAEARRIKGAA